MHSDYNSSQLLNYLQPLVDWRHQQGYVVDVVSIAETGTSTSLIKSYISDAYNYWDNPPEYVCFVGDADGTYAVPTYYVQEGNGWSGAAGEGDYPYSLIDGGVNDLYADVILGRISIRSLTEDLNTVVNKIIGYEKAYGGIDDWQEKAALIGDPYESGISTVITNQYIEQLMYTYGVEDVRTKYSGNNFDDFMRAQFNDGIAFLNYRGIYGFSGFTSNDVNALSPTWKLPFVTTLTCDTGSFWADNECISEALFRAGSPAQPKGAVAAVGIAQSYTHTAFNNIVDMGMYEGMYIFDAWHAGEALEYGRIALTQTYPDNPNNNVYLFSTWNNLMGDPLTHLWTLKPIEISVEHKQNINFGTNYFQVEVVDQNDSPVSDAIVTLLKSGQSQNDEDEMFLTKKTDSNGVAFFDLDYLTDGEVLVTVIGRNMKPSETSFEIQDQQISLELVQNSIQIDDSVGNMNGVLNGGETAYIQLQLSNTGSETLSDIEVELLSSNDAISVNSSASLISSLGSGETSNFLNFEVTVSSDADSESFFNSSLYISAIGFEYVVPVIVSHADLTFSPIMQTDGNNNGIFDRGESASFSVMATNLGSHGLGSLTGEILYSGSQLEFESSIINWPSIQGSSFSSSEPIDVIADSDIINGSIISIPIEISSTDGYSTLYNWQVTVGNASINDPLGPDFHGYYIYDQSDDYDLAPVYDWVEIDADLGGPGYQLNIDDDGDNGDDSQTIDLPFTFTFYGTDYDQITVCSNGWISFGQTDMTSFRNYSLPGPGGPSPMLAVFWDDLQMNSGGDIYAWHDTQSDAFVIEWSGLRTFQLNSLNTFQAILYNSDYLTPTGDDEIKLQYKVFNNTSYGEYPVGNNFGAVIHGIYTTVGIENYNGQVGLEYTHDNQYPLTSMILDDETSLFITTRLSGSVPISIAHQQYPFEMPYSGSSISFDATVSSNTGSMNSVLFNYNLGQGWQSSQMTSFSGDNYNFILNGIDSGTAISYFFEAENSDGEQLVYPQSGTEDPFFFVYGEMPEIYSSNFESSSDGWSIGDLDDDAETGIWIRAIPNGTTYDGIPVQTSSANSGQYCYVTGNYTSNNPSAGDDDVDEGKTTLFSPVYDLSNYSYGLVSYYRWYTNEFGAAPGDDYWLVYASNDAGNSWVEIERTNQSENSWTKKTLFISDFLGLTDLMQFKFIASDDGEGSLVEAAIDDFQIRGASISYSYQDGDVNNDGILNILDILSIINITLGDVVPEPLEEGAADVNNDSIINILDIIVLVNLILGS
ncbi:MAG: hypothetical protein CBD58_01635 [bacterium TMED198]|nr:MAG: hypothetical protein CBD58_01635 [bacterium TMED198]